MRVFSEITRRTAWAGLLAPWAVIPALVPIWLWDLVQARAMPRYLDLNDYWLMAGFGVMIAYVLTLLYGLPVYRLLMRHDAAQAPFVILVAVVPTILLGAAQDDLIAGLVFSYFPVVVALAVHWRMRRPLT